MNENPGGYPTGPFDNSWDYASRDHANTLADIRAEVVAAVEALMLPILDWLARRVAR